MSEHDPRILKHIHSLAEVGTDLERFTAALDAIRTDRNLPSAGKTAILKTLAQEQAIHFLAACSGQKPKPVTPAEG